MRLIWIPVTEELPYTNETVLISTSDGRVQLGYLSGNNIWHGINLIGMWQSRLDVLAWMRLPESYRENTNG